VVAVEIAFNHNDTPRQNAWTRSRFGGLTGRQAEILRAVVWGMSADDIARWLAISPRTVELHRAQALARIGARNVADAVRIAITHGFDFQPDPRTEASGRAAVPAVTVHALEPGEAAQLHARLERHFDGDRIAGSFGGAVSQPARGAYEAFGSETASHSGIAEGSPLVRVIGLPGRTYDDRVHWVGAWATIEQEMTYSPWNTRLLAQAGMRFDVVLVHGDEDRRVAHLLREFREVYPSKLMIAVLSHARAAERALLYRAGADAVFDLFSEGGVASAWLLNAIKRQEGLMVERPVPTSRASLRCWARRTSRAPKLNSSTSSNRTRGARSATPALPS
jgi:DNA-binding CsgD family transcriptional regulator